VLRSDDPRSPNTLQDRKRMGNGNVEEVFDESLMFESANCEVEDERENDE